MQAEAEDRDPDPQREEEHTGYDAQIGEGIMKIVWGERKREHADMVGEWMVKDRKPRMKGRRWDY